MKLLVAGCIHGDVLTAKRLADKAVRGNVDAIVIAGDFSGPGENVEGVFGELLKAGKRILMLPGNHESLATAEFVAQKYDLVSLHDRYYKLGELGIVGNSASNLGMFQFSEDEIYSSIKKNLEKIQADKKMVVSHVHPDDSLITKMSGWSGSKGLKAVIDSLQPDFAVSAHIHETEGLEHSIGKTKHHSVGRRGTILEV